MKISTLAAACALATLGTTASAQNYVGVGIGSTRACFSFDATGTCTGNATTGKLLLGYTLPGTDFAIEGAYTHMGSFKGNSALGAAEFKVDMLGVGGAWRPQFGAGFGGVLRGGLDFGKTRADYGGAQLGTPITIFQVSTSHGYWQPYIGAGATYAITPSIRLEADLDDTRVKASRQPINARTFSLGATFGF
jgi:hypothetical protein